MRVLAIVAMGAVLWRGTAGAADIRGAWFPKAKYGVFVHFLGGGDGWNEQVERFDADAFAQQMKEAGAAYVIFTLGQNSGYYCSPNATYSNYCGYEPGDRCSNRDLPKDLIEALGKHGIRLMLYLPSRAPQADKNAMERLNDVHERQPAPQEFTKRWSEVICEWALRYGKNVHGWWFDGSYNTAGWDDLDEPYNWATWAAACRAGNPDSILAFNPGTNLEKAFSRLTGEQDYTAGEQNSFTVLPEQYPAPEGMTWHILAHLGTSWARSDGPQHSDQAMIDYIRTVNAQGGVVSIDVHVEDGRLYAPHLAQLKAIAGAIR
ncbi:MAG: alpha-L-fucosidase [Candidatus Hydrogenedentes bacterium]|nr:alpha-L-fucosidase [Candidatus Hydrogenedentota bacterium]